MFKKSLFSLLTLLTLSIFQGNAQDNFLKEWAEKGFVESENYYSELPFQYIDGYIFIDIVQNGNKYNFLFDTGAETTVIDNSILNQFSFEPFSETRINGPIIKDQDVETIILSNIHIADIMFSEIGAVSIDMEFSKERFCEDLHGIIGSNLMKKSKWQIDYKKQVIKFSNDISKFQLDNPKYVLETKLSSKGFGTETVDINLNGQTIPFNFDTGNGARKIVANPSNFKKIIKKSKSAEYGFPKSPKDYHVLPEKLFIGGIEFSNQMVTFENKVGESKLLGNKFYENFLVTIDWENHQLYLEPQGEIKQDEFYGFPLEFRPNYKTNKIEIYTGIRDFLKKNKIEKGSILAKINGIDILNLSDKEFCEFWDLSWSKIKTEKTINLTIAKDGKEKEIVVSKNKLVT